MSNEKQEDDTEAVEASLCNRKRVYRGEAKDTGGWFDMLRQVRHTIISFVTAKEAGRLAIVSKTHHGLLGSVPWQMCAPLKVDECFPSWLKIQPSNIVARNILHFEV